MNSSCGTVQPMAPPERHHKGLLRHQAIRGSSNAAPPTAHQHGTTNGSSDAAKGLQEEMGIKQTAPPALPGKHCSAGVAQSNLRAGAKTRSSGLMTPRTPPGRQTPRALPSTQQEMAPPERHRKGILCGRALRGSSNAAPSTASSVAPPTAPPMQQRGSKKSWARTKCSSGAPCRHCSAGVAQSNL